MPNAAPKPAMQIDRMPLGAGPAAAKKAEVSLLNGQS
jgi:hypothetical protein